MLRYAIVFCAILCYAALCYAMLCYAMLCYDDPKDQGYFINAPKDQGHLQIYMTLAREQEILHLPSP